MASETIKMVYSYKVSYEDEAHRKELIDRLKKEPSFGYFGSGVTKKGKMCAFSIVLKGKGKMLKDIVI